MRKSRPVLKVPQEYHDDKPELERKYRIVRGQDFQSRCIRLDEIFNVVASGHEYFVTLDRAPHTADYDPRLLAVVESPIEIKPLRTRLYWGTVSLVGYKPGDRDKIEIRTEEKIGKHNWQQVLKLGRDGGKTLDRGEYKRALDGFGINLDIYPEKIRKKAKSLLGGHICKPLVRLEGQSKPLLYHPQGRSDILLEIKFDKTIGKTIDGFCDAQAEVEIEIKEHPPSMSKAQLETLLDEAEQFLFRDFADSLESIYESKVSRLFQHLASCRARDTGAFTRTFDALPGDRWATCAPL